MKSLDSARDSTAVSINCTWDCGVCSAVCPANCIENKDHVVKIHLRACQLCFACLKVCPAGLIGERDLERV